MEKRVKFTGYVPYDEIPYYYASVDMVVYPTMYEPLGNVIMESMAAGKPIIASAVDGIPEIFKPSTGFLIEPSAEGVEEKVKLLLTDSGLCKKMGELGKEMVKDHTWVVVAKETIRVCEKIINKRS
jgi:glycosyltransferase involved in cell wall biosynthesis